MQDFDSVLVRLYEESAEELGRLDALVAMAPAAVSTVLQLSAIAHLATQGGGATEDGRDTTADTDASQAMRAALASLVAARVDLLHAAALSATLGDWQQRVEDGERRARSGATLAMPALAPDDTARRRVADALRPGSEPRPLLWRSLEVLAWSSETAESELLTGLLLVAGGLADRLHQLPFAGVRGTARAEACALWRAGDPAALTRAGLSALAVDARHLRVQVRLLCDAQLDEDAHLASVGRAAVTGRRALAALRSSLATSVPDLSERLALSRPAAGAALERLVELGLAEEITGRARDRVFVYAAAWGLV